MSGTVTLDDARQAAQRLRLHLWAYGVDPSAVNAGIAVKDDNEVVLTYGISGSVLRVARIELSEFEGYAVEEGAFDHVTSLQPGNVR